MEESRLALPEWARPGRWRLTRWDGGPLEAEKGRLSGWPGYEVGTAHVAAVRRWYDARTIRLAQRAGYDAVWVTWSVGLSPASEAAQQELVRRFIRACHGQGVRVIAYLSIANMMVDDLFGALPEAVDWAARDATGNFIPYSAARYTGHVTRVMADVRNRDWQDRYLLPQVQGAIRAGADGVVFDNTFGSAGHEPVGVLLRRVHACIRAINPPAAVVMSNYNRRIWHWARLENAVTTEDAIEPGFPEQLPLEPAGPTGMTASVRSPTDAPPYVPPFGFASNVGLLQINTAVGEGWRPVFVEYGQRLAGGRFSRQMAPERAQLAAAECAAFGAQLELYVEPQCGALLVEQPEALAVLDAVGDYHRFFDRHREWYAEGWTSVARVTVIEAPDYEAHHVLDLLARAGILCVVVLDADEPDLDRADVVVLTEAVYSEGLLRRAGQRVARGRCVLQLVHAGTPAIDGAERFAPEAAQELVRRCRSRVEPAQIVGIWAPDRVILSARRRADRLLVQLLNYRPDEPVSVELQVRAPVREATWYAPGLSQGQALPVGHGQSERFRLPLTGSYHVLEAVLA